MEIADHLSDKNASIASDCIKVLYEVGYIAPALINPYANTFPSLLESKNNLMVWGAMTALSTIAEYVPEKIYPHRDKVFHLIEAGTAITNFSVVRIIINMAKAVEPFYSALIAGLFQLQESCRSVDFAKRAKEVAAVCKPENFP